MVAAQKHKLATRPRAKTLWFLFLLLVALLLISESLYWSIPVIQAGVKHWAAYLNWNWAHQATLIQILLNFVLALWLSVTVLYFGGWLARRSFRKLQGKPWSLERNGIQGKKFFPPVLLYLKISCLFLVLIIAFVILQYPLQFMMNFS
ncbi:MAG TPA: hypothetical protein ENK06_03325 [Gammaproteobacteria bacterium]|nr:hypothetical protein [Gammaproteobacteria bacterium]